MSFAVGTGVLMCNYLLRNFKTKLNLRPNVCTVGLLSEGTAANSRGSTAVPMQNCLWFYWFCSVSLTLILLPQYTVAECHFCSQAFRRYAKSSAKILQKMQQSLVCKPQCCVSCLIFSPGEHSGTCSYHRPPQPLPAFILPVNLQSIITLFSSQFDEGIPPPQKKNLA